MKNIREFYEKIINLFFFTPLFVGLLIILVLILFPAKLEII